MANTTKIEVNPAGTLVTVRFFGHVTAEDMRTHLTEVDELASKVHSGFTILADLTGLGSMDPSCADVLRLVMDRMNGFGAGRIVRVIPDPRKDIGLNILSLFHYRRGTPIHTCTTLAEAMALIG